MKLSQKVYGKTDFLRQIRLNVFSTNDYLHINNQFMTFAVYIFNMDIFVFRQKVA